jgi:hypothetical protein
MVEMFSSGQKANMNEEI